MDNFLINGSFGGAGSFMTNGYAIWRRGLDQEDPNPYAVHQGETYAQRMFYDRSLDSRSSFYKFYTYLLAIANKEAQKERSFLEKEFSRIQSEGLSTKLSTSIQTAIANDNFGFAYTLMLKNQQEFDELVREFNGGKFRNISHTNEFWNKQFSGFLKRKLEESVEIQDEKLGQKLNLNSNLTIDSLVNEWASELIFGSNGVVVSSIEPLKQQMKKELLQYFNKAGIVGVNSIFDNIFGVNNDLSKLTKNQTIRTSKGKRRRSIKTLAKEISDGIGSGVGKGLSQELITLSGQGKRGVSFSTGKLMKHIKNEFTGKEDEVQQKGDTLSFQVFNGSFDLQAIANESFDEAIAPTKEQIEAFIDKIRKQAQITDEIFQITTNVKGYRSRMNLTIAKSASYSQRASDLIHMAQEAEGLPALSMEKLIFMFNNTMSGCLQENRIHYIEEYVAAICAAWLWDDYGELFSLAEDNGPIKKIRMFNSGGIYYSASQLIKTAAEQLSDNEKTKKQNFIKVDFAPPTFNADIYYAELKAKNPVPSLSASYDEWQGQLKKRWDAMRNKVLKEGKIHISIAQQELEKILGELSLYL